MKTIGIFTLDPWTLLDESAMKAELLYFDHLKYFIRGKEILENICNSLTRGKESFDKRMKELDELGKLGLISEYTLQQFELDHAKYKDEKVIEQAWKRYELANQFTTKEASDLNQYELSNQK